jgi:hypothetical protein
LSPTAGGPTNRNFTGFLYFFPHEKLAHSHGKVPFHCRPQQANFAALSKPKVFFRFPHQYNNNAISLQRYPCHLWQYNILVATLGFSRTVRFISVIRACCQLIFKIFCQINKKIRPLAKKFGP